MFGLGNGKADQLEVAREIEAALTNAKIIFKRRDNTSSAPLTIDSLGRPIGARIENEIVFDIFLTSESKAGAIVVARAGSSNNGAFRGIFSSFFKKAYVGAGVSILDKEGKAWSIRSMLTTRNLILAGLTPEQIKELRDYRGLVEFARSICVFQGNSGRIESMVESINRSQVIGRAMRASQEMDARYGG